ncbi:unnamed protein product [Cladocopium goreaui]|uniref:Uncharacterized protein n=1 Tax=Cladocopium goreaui TaxID=2562237 RepID=A0A9P1CPN7_9DINO|nr:unnamed protein product [Cladocopium goreaui]
MDVQPDIDLVSIFNEVFLVQTYLHKLEIIEEIITDISDFVEDQALPQPSVQLNAMRQQVGQVKIQLRFLLQLKLLEACRRLRQHVLQYGHLPLLNLDFRFLCTWTGTESPRRWRALGLTVMLLSLGLAALLGIQRLQPAAAEPESVEELFVSPYNVEASTDDTNLEFMDVVGGLPGVPFTPEQLEQKKIEWKSPPTTPKPGETPTPPPTQSRAEVDSNDCYKGEEFFAGWGCPSGFERICGLLWPLRFFPFNDDNSSSRFLRDLHSLAISQSGSIRHNFVSA